MFLTDLKFSSWAAGASSKPCCHVHNMLFAELSDSHQSESTGSSWLQTGWPPSPGPDLAEKEKKNNLSISRALEAFCLRYA